ncbi:MAG: LURP-one-related family protein [Deltaproteobacteria bacterium]|nr:LURP-one-related family protein [Deltaproteobacteria bacterium]
MRYVMKEKVFCLGNDYTVQDEDGSARFVIDGKTFSVGDKLALLDTDGVELAQIRQKVLAWGATYEIFRDGELAAVIKQKAFTLLKCRFTVDVPGPDDLEATGDFLDHEYVFSRQGEEVARVSKQWFTWRDTYGIDVGAGEDDVLIIASAVVIDLCCHDDESS